MTTRTHISVINAAVLGSSKTKTEIEETIAALISFDQELNELDPAGLFQLMGPAVQRHYRTWSDTCTTYEVAERDTKATWYPEMQWQCDLLNITLHEGDFFDAFHARDDLFTDLNPVRIVDFDACRTFKQMWEQEKLGLEMRRISQNNRICQDGFYLVITHSQRGSKRWEQEYYADQLERVLAAAGWKPVQSGNWVDEDVLPPCIVNHGQTRRWETQPTRLRFNYKSSSPGTPMACCVWKFIKE